MNQRDVRLYETGSGGDFQVIGNRLSGCFSFENFPYLAMFGGNPGFITKEKTEGELNLDYWGNTLLWAENEEVQFNSRTENVLNTVALNSRGRKIIEEAVISDLNFMTAFAELDVTVEILGLNKVGINIILIEPKNGVERRFMYIWDGARLIDESITSLTKPPTSEGLQYALEFDLG